MDDSDERRMSYKPRHWFRRGGGFRAELGVAPFAVELESGPGYGDHGRWSIASWNPDAVFTVRGGEWNLSTADRRTIENPPTALSPIEAFRSLIHQTRFSLDDPEHHELPFHGGWIGFIGYDFAPQLERVPRRHRPATTPDMCWMYFPWAQVTDRRQGKSITVSDSRFNDALGLRKRRNLPLDSSWPNQASSPPSCPPATMPPKSDWSKDEYLAAVKRVIEYIRAGDVFQANLTHRFWTVLHHEWAWPDQMVNLWDRCLATSPAPFSALIKTPEWSVLSTSPERFLLVEPDGKVETRPIKGTRPRGKSAKEDLAQMTELLSSAKDRAELAMIVDLERNDLGRVCQFGSVKVSQHAALESYSNVHHLVSTVEGRLRDGCDVVDLLAAAFPGGSITGAPKIRAMEIIDELEACSRGVYTGAIGYISDHGRADFNIAIRTLVVEGDRAHFHVGGGITADSDPQAEYEETLTKGSKLTQILTESP